MMRVSSESPEGIIRWHYLWYVAAVLAMMVAAIVIQNVWLLNFVHVFSSLLWTGIDLFMGFVLGPILRRVDISVRRGIMHCNVLYRCLQVRRGRTSRIRGI